MDYLLANLCRISFQSLWLEPRRERTGSDRRITEGNLPLLKTGIPHLSLAQPEVALLLNRSMDSLYHNPVELVKLLAPAFSLYVGGRTVTESRENVHAALMATFLEQQTPKQWQLINCFSNSSQHSSNFSEVCVEHRTDDLTVPMSSVTLDTAMFIFRFSDAYEITSLRVYMNDQWYFKKVLEKLTISHRSRIRLCRSESPAPAIANTHQ